MDLGFRMHAERTPNPNSIKWVLSQPVVEGVAAAHFDSAPGALASPLADALFEVDGVVAVFLGPNFVTVSKREELEWADLAEPIVTRIKAWVESKAAALGEDYEAPDRGDQGEVVARIVQILENDIRPYVQQDGGEITFAGFQDGIVQLYLQGSCAGCPSSTVTLKHGIESRLREELPEVLGVEAIA